MGVNSLPKTVTRQRRDCDLNPGPSAPESSTLTSRLPSHPIRSETRLDVKISNKLAPPTGVDSIRISRYLAVWRQKTTVPELSCCVVFVILCVLPFWYSIGL